MKAKAVRNMMLRHAAYSASLLLGALLLAQFLFESVPGDPARRALGPYASQESVIRLRHEMGLDRPLVERLAANIRSALRFDFGHSIIDGRAVAPEIGEKFTRTFTLGFQAVTIAVAISLLLLAVIHFQPRAAFLLQLAGAPVILPSFLSAVLVAIGAALWLPAMFGSSGSSRVFPAPLLPSLVAAIYPASVLATSLGARWSALRSAPHYRSARAFGLSRIQLLFRALLAPSAPTVLALIVSQLSVVVFALLVIEIIFSLPGAGTLMLASIQANDYPMLQGVLIINAFVFITLHFLSESLYPILDPRVAK
ncbi:MAG: Glutathione transport system permease protein GsiC [Verrucomicrobiae bacterium]|nr:Glutathione transport system permease protein GsiC [Verrucomicrobiae bacterium]